MKLYRARFLSSYIAHTNVTPRECLVDTNVCIVYVSLSPEYVPTAAAGAEMTRQRALCPRWGGVKLALPGATTSPGKHKAS